MQSKIEFKTLLEKFDIWDLWQEKYRLKNMALFYGRQKRLYLPLDELLKIASLHTVLNSILINDDWDTIDSIDISSLLVGNTYVKKCIADIAELKDREDYHHVELLIYYAIAIRFYIEKTNIKVPIPSTKLSAEQAKADFQELKAIDPHILSLESNVGRKASNYFMEELRFSCRKQGKNLTFPEAWESPSLIGKIVSHLKKNKCITPSCFNRIRTDMTASQFRPATIKYLTNYINNLDHRVAITKYINLCGGWGDRLVGALGTEEIKRYIQTDPNETLFDATEEIYNTYDPSHETAVHLYKKPLEDLTLEELCPNQQKNDLVAYSPPYFNKELYAGENQSYKRYPTIDSWVTGFLYKSVEISYKALKVHGVLALNLANIQLANQTFYNLTDCLIHYLENDMSPFFSKFSEPMIYPTKNVPHLSKIFLYQAKEYRDVVPKLISFSMEPWTIYKGKKEKSENKKEKPSITSIGVFPCAAIKPSIGYQPNSSRSNLPMFSLFNQNSNSPTPQPQIKIMEDHPVYKLTLDELHTVILQEVTAIDVAKRLGIEFYQLHNLLNDIGWNYSMLHGVTKYQAMQNAGDNYYKTLASITHIDTLQVPFTASVIEPSLYPQQFMDATKRKRSASEDENELKENVQKRGRLS